MPAQFVKPFLKSNKNDYLDAEAIAEAVQRPNMRFVPIKTDDQLDLQALHRVRDRLVSRRTSVINQLRAFLLERGITFRQGRAYLRKVIPELLEDAEQRLSPRMRRLVDRLWQEWEALEEQIEALSGEIDSIASQDAACQRLLDVPGVGPLAATALVAAIGNGSAFTKGRDFTAWHRLCISSLNVAKKSVTVAYRVALSSTNCIDCSILTSLVSSHGLF
jgi:transposase